MAIIDFAQNEPSFQSFWVGDNSNWSLPCDGAHVGACSFCANDVTCREQAIALIEGFECNGDLSTRVPDVSR
jgi:hypothetical protein